VIGRLRLRLKSPSSRVDACAGEPAGAQGSPPDADAVCVKFPALIDAHESEAGFGLIEVLVSAIILVPLAGFWALVERNRWSTVILGVACLAVAVMVYRMYQIWAVQVA